MKVLIIGSGIAGYRAASTLRQADRDMEVTMLSRETDTLYSPCVLPYYVAGKISREKTFVRSLDDYRRLGIQTELGCEATAIDIDGKRVIRAEGKPIGYDKLILAIGSHAVKMDQSLGGIFYLKTLADADALIKHRGKSAVVVGSGNIGIEVAIALKHRGYQVAVLARSAVLRRSFDPTMEAKIKEILESYGITVLVKEKPTQVLGDDSVTGVKTDNREIACDTLVWAVGVRPQVKLAEDAGLKLGQTGGIKVNSYMQTNASGVYACGDCAETRDLVSGRPALNLFWHNANRQGAVAAYNCLGVKRAYAGSENMLSMRIFDTHLATFGHTESSLKSGAAEGWESDVISVVEQEKEGSHTRFVLCGDRCVGAQFINPSGRTGLIRGMMCQRRNLRDICDVCKDLKGLPHRSLLYPVKSFFE